MDELLALMDDDVSVQVSVSSSTADIPVRSEVRVVEQTVATAVDNQSLAPDRSHSDLDQSLNVDSQQVRVEASIDNKLGIRLIKRRMSSSELMDLVSTHPFHSTSAIGAMSLAALNRLLVEPTSVVSAATVSGKLTTVTVGIVFTNSGTRISSSGRAFSVLSIGNLQTGPVVSVFLFGEAYSRHCSKCPAGTVIALVTPSLLPLKEDSRDTAVSLSVADHRQLIPMAQARDYGACKGTVRGKRADGQWVSNGGQCKHFVDVRVSQYCDKHRKQTNVKNGPVNKGKSLSFIQQQRMEHGSKAFVPNAPMAKCVMTMQMPGAGLVVTHKPVKAQSSIEAELEEFSKTSGRFVNVPMHLKMQAPQPLPTSRSTLFQGVASNRRPLAHAKTAAQSRSTLASQPCSRLGSQPIHDDWLNPLGSQSKDKTSLTGRKRAVNKDTDGFDGSVAVPKPSKLFRGKALPQRSRNAASNERALNESKIDSIRQQQRLLAERQKENTQLQGENLARRKLGGRQTKASSDEAIKDSLFGQFSVMSTEQLLNARSQFADEADAEAYAKSRRVVTDLERREEQKINANKTKATKESAIQKEWVCATCKRTSKAMPNLCIRAKHKVTFTREVKKSDTVQERRLKLDAKSAEDGGLKLGAGLEWGRRSEKF